MAKSGNNIHGTLRKRVYREYGTKAFFVENFLDDEGWTIEKGPVENRGEWNQHSKIHVVYGEIKIHIDSRGPGDRTDWKDATRTFCREAYGWSYRELEDQSAGWG
jgi:hypothetical protein